MNKKTVYLRTVQLLVYDVNSYIKASKENKAKMPSDSQSEQQVIEKLAVSFVNLLTQMWLQNNPMNLKKQKAIQLLQFYKSYLGVTKTLNRSIDEVIKYSLRKESDKNWQTLFNKFLYTATIFDYLQNSEDRNYHLSAIKEIVTNTQEFMLNKKSQNKEFLALYSDIRFSDDMINWNEQGGNSFRQKRLFDQIGEQMNNNMSLDLDFKIITKDFLKIIWESTISLEKDETYKLGEFKKLNTRRPARRQRQTSAQTYCDFLQSLAQTSHRFTLTFEQTYKDFIINMVREENDEFISKIMDVQFRIRLDTTQLEEVESYLTAKLQTFNKEHLPTVETWRQLEKNTRFIYKKSISNWIELYIKHSSFCIQTDDLKTQYEEFQMYVSKVLHYEDSNLLGNLDIVSYSWLVINVLDSKVLSDEVKLHFCENFYGSMDKYYKMMTGKVTDTSLLIHLMRNQDIIYSLIDAHNQNDLEIVKMRQKISEKNDFYMEKYFSDGAQNFMHLSRKGQKIDSRSQIKTEETLQALGVTYEAEAYVKKYHVDFKVGDNTIVEVMGPIHFVTEKNLMVTRDRFKLDYLKSFGYKIVIITWDDLPNNLEQRCEVIKKKLDL